MEGDKHRCCEDSCLDSFPSNICQYLTSVLGTNALSGLQVSAAKSAQQKVWILSNLNVSSSTVLASLPLEWKSALDSGRNRLVIRQWRASSCWWNLNRNQQESQDGVAVLARSEIAGYRIAKKALPKIHIPSVLYFSHDADEIIDTVQHTLNEKPWAILSYVGPLSVLFDDTTWQSSDYWMNRMVKNRLEFGFEEPHPRWGRVPASECVDYTLSVLRNVTIPLHSYMQQKQLSGEIIASLQGSNASPQSSPKGYTYSDMVHLYQEALAEIRKKSKMLEDRKLRAAIEILDVAIANLKKQQPYLESESAAESSLPGVLCHMDCQPQNLLFAQPPAAAAAAAAAGEELNNNKGPTMLDSSLPKISSVLDWEEAALADPRFELLLLCRKVCANRDQAEQIWSTYEQECPSQQPAKLGPLEPWLALETVHSVTSLVLQSMDLLGGGRNPWESKPDLWGKIQREIQRLIREYGWDFCDVPEFRIS